MDASKLSVKLILDNDFRRLSQPTDVTFTQLVNQICTIYRLDEKKALDLVLKYQDEEGDYCTVTSDEELEEAKRFALSQSKVLRFHLSFRSTVPTPVRTCPVWSPKPWSGKGFKGAGGCPGFAGRRHQRRVKYFELQESGLGLMKTDLNKALTVFKEQLEHSCQRDIHLPLYNIACCYALLGDQPNALDYLSQAVSKGMRDPAHIASDEDLVSLRETAEFKALVVKAREPWTPSFGHGCKRWEHCQKQSDAQAEPAPEQQSAPEGLTNLFGVPLEQVAQQFMANVNNIPIDDIAAQIQAQLPHMREQLPILQQHLQNGLPHIQEQFQQFFRGIQNFANTVQVPCAAQAQSEVPAPEQAPEVAPEVVAEQPKVDEPVAPEVAAEEKNPLEEVYEVPLKALAEMGFIDKAANLAALDAADGDLSVVIPAPWNSSETDNGNSEKK